MANIDSIIAADLAATAYNGDAVGSPCDMIIYNGSGIVAIILRNRGDKESDGYGSAEIGEIEFAVTVDAVGSPTADDAVTFNGQTYKVVRWVRSAGQWIITATRVVQLQRSSGQTNAERG